MNILEKVFSLFAVSFAIGLIAVITIYPQTRELKVLLPLSLAGVAINIGLMFVVLRDILYRTFTQPMAKYVWIAVILLFWPAVLYYLPRHGFKSR
jgi:hypothetical protein